MIYTNFIGLCYVYTITLPISMGNNVWITDMHRLTIFPMPKALTNKYKIGFKWWK